MKILKLTIKYNWYVLIKELIKKHEYREIKKSWINKFFISKNPKFKTAFQYYEAILFNFKELKTDVDVLGYLLNNKLIEWVKYDAIHFYNGAYFSNKLPNFLIECKGIELGTGITEHGALPNVNYFKLKLGDLIK